MNFDYYFVIGRNIYLTSVAAKNLQLLGILEKLYSYTISEFWSSVTEYCRLPVHLC